MITPVGTDPALILATLRPSRTLKTCAALYLPTAKQGTHLAATISGCIDAQTGCGGNVALASANENGEQEMTNKSQRHRGSTAGVDEPEWLSDLRAWAYPNEADSLVVAAMKKAARVLRQMDREKVWISNDVTEAVDMLQSAIAALASLSQTPATPMVQEGLGEALERIASCDSHHPDDVVAIARRALSDTPAPPVDETDRLREAVQDGIDQLHWINAQAENAMATSAGAATANGDSDGALQMLNSIASDIGVNAMMLSDKLSAALADRTQEGEVQP